MITESFDTQTKPLISPGDFYGEQKHLVDVCLITFSRVIANSILHTYQCERIAEFSFPNGEYPIYKFKYKGKNIAFYVSMIGSALAAEMVVEANWLIGATKFVMFGSAGSLDKIKTKKRFVIPSAAYRDEGMSYHYADPQDYIKIKNAQNVCKIMSELKLPFIEGKIWTTDAILRETTGQTAKRRADGCLAVEMEVAGVQAVCDFHGLELYNFLMTGDVLTESSYDVNGLSAANHNFAMLAVALEIAMRL